MDEGMNVARFNFSHGEHAGHKEVGGCSVGAGWGGCQRLASHDADHTPICPHTQPTQVLDRVRKVAAAKGKHVGLALDTKGPEIRTAMLRGGKDILLVEGRGCGWSSAESRLRGSKQECCSVRR